MATLTSFWSRACQENDVDISHAALAFMNAQLSTSSSYYGRQVRWQLQHHFGVAHVTHWQQQMSAATTETALMVALLQFAYYTCVRCERHKVTWMQPYENDDNNMYASSLPMVLSTLLVRQQQCNSDDDDALLTCCCCQLITTLCTYEGDDDHDADQAHNAAAAPIVSHAHDHGQAFVATGVVVPVLLHLLRSSSCSSSSSNTTGSSSSSSSIVRCLRSLATNDETVQSMVTAGVLTVLPELSQDGLEWWTAVMGLWRNLCANDDIKTKLCRDGRTVPAMLAAMERYRDAGMMQEHACGTVAAMALRSRTNATYLLEQDVTSAIVRAMQTHPHRAACQRQACLAIRNLASRGTVADKAKMLECNVEPVLRQIAAAHLTCQDETYAALRDLGCPVGSVQMETNVHDGRFIHVQARPMFGDVTPNVRRDVF